MPTYIYECRPCNWVFSLKRAIDERDLPAHCPKCSVETSKRLLTSPILIQPHNRRESLADEDRQDVPTVPGNVFINCSAEGNGQGGFRFRGGRHVMFNTRSTNNPIGIDIGDDAEVIDYDTTIE